MASNIFSVKNRTLREMYVGSSQLSIAELRALYRTAPPPIIRHWDFQRHDLRYEEIQRGVPDGQSSFFLRDCSLLKGLPGWRTIVEGIG